MRLWKDTPHTHTVADRLHTYYSESRDQTKRSKLNTNSLKHNLRQVWHWEVTFGQIFNQTKKHWLGISLNLADENYICVCVHSSCSVNVTDWRPSNGSLQKKSWSAFVWDRHDFTEDNNNWTTKLCCAQIWQGCSNACRVTFRMWKMFCWANTEINATKHRLNSKRMT